MKNSLFTFFKNFFYAHKELGIDVSILITTSILTTAAESKTKTKMSQLDADSTSDDLLTSSVEKSRQTESTRVARDEGKQEEKSSSFVQLSSPQSALNAAVRTGKHSSPSPSSIKKAIPKAEYFSEEMVVEGDRTRRKRSSRHRGIHHRHHSRRSPSTKAERKDLTVNVENAEEVHHGHPHSKVPRSFLSTPLYLPEDTEEVVVSSPRSRSVPITSAEAPSPFRPTDALPSKILTDVSSGKHNVDEKRKHSSPNRKKESYSDGSAVDEVVEVSITRKIDDIFPLHSHFSATEHLPSQNPTSAIGRCSFTPAPHISAEGATQRLLNDLPVVTIHTSSGGEVDGSGHRVEEDVENDGPLPPSSSEVTIAPSSTPLLKVVNCPAPVVINPFHPHTEMLDGGGDSFRLTSSYTGASDFMPLHGGGTLENTISGPPNTVNASFVPASAVAELGGEKKYRAKMRKFASKIRGSAVPPFSYYPRLTEIPSCQMTNDSFIASPSFPFPPSNEVRRAQGEGKIDGGGDVAMESTPKKTKKRRRARTSPSSSPSRVVHFNSSTGNKAESQETECTANRRDKRGKKHVAEEDHSEDSSYRRNVSGRSETKREQMEKSNRRSSHDDGLSPPHSGGIVFASPIQREPFRKAKEDPQEMSSPFHSLRPATHLNATSSLFFLNNTKHIQNSISPLSPTSAGFTDISHLLRLEGRCTEHQRFTLPTCPPYRIPLYDQTVFKYVFASLYAERITLWQLVFLVSSLAMFVVNILMTVVNVLFTLTLANEISVWIRAVAEVCFILEFAIVLACVVCLVIVCIDAFLTDNIGTSLAHDTSTLITVGGSFSVLRFFGLATPLFAMRRIVPLFQRANTKKDYLLAAISVLLWIGVCFVSFLVLVSKLAQVYFALALPIAEWTLVDYIRFVGLCVNISRVDDSYFKEMSVLLDAVHRHYYFPGEVQEMHPYETPCLLSRIRIYLGIPNYMYFTLFDTIYNFHWRSKYEREELVRQFLRAEKAKHKNLHESMRSDKTDGSRNKSMVSGGDVLRDSHEVGDDLGMKGNEGGGEHQRKSKDCDAVRTQDENRKGRREGDDANPGELRRFMGGSFPVVGRPTTVTPKKALPLELASSRPLVHERAITRFRCSGGLSEENELSTSFFSANLHTVGRMGPEKKEREKEQGRGDGNAPPEDPASLLNTIRELMHEKTVSPDHFSGASLVDLVEKLREVSSDEPSLLTTCLSRRQRFWLMLNYLAFIFEVDPVQLRRYLQMVQSPLPFYQLGRDAFMKSFVEDDTVGMDTAVRHSEPQSSSTANYALRDPQQFFPSFTCDDGRRLWNATACAEQWNRRDMERTREMVHCFEMAKKYK